jgi:hypothetical protein
MITRYRNNIEPGDPGKEKEIFNRQAGTGSDDTCRCKEASKMSPGQLLKLMMSDLAFWKKGKKV